MEKVKENIMAIFKKGNVSPEGEAGIEISLSKISNPYIRGDKKKFDEDKPMWDLIPLKAVEKIVEVFAYGAKKYGRDTWQTIEDGENRYFAAAMRHLVKHQAGERIDSESGLSHLAHAACNLVFLMFLNEKNIDKT